MKLIAKKNFYRVPALQSIDFGDEQPHENHVERGNVFELGNFTSFDDLLKNPRTPEKHLCAELMVAGCIADAGDEKAVKEIKARIADEKASRTAAEKMNLNATGQLAVNQLLDLIQKLSAVIPPAAPAK